MDLTLIIGFVVGVLAPVIFMSFLPNKKFKAWGTVVGKKASLKGSKLIGKENWEKLENNLTGSVLSFAQGFVEGADLDD